MTHRELERQIRQLVAEQRYPEVTPLLHEYAAEVVDRCVHAADEEEFQAARVFLRSTLELVKAQRAHDSVRLANLGRQRRYLSSTSTPEPAVDVSG